MIKESAPTTVHVNQEGGRGFLWHLQVGGRRS